MQKHAAAFIFILVSVVVTGCSKKEPEIKFNHLRDFQVSAVCHDIHIKRPADYDGWLKVYEVESAKRSKDMVTVGFVTRLKKTNIGHEAVAAAQNPRLYFPPVNISLHADNADILFNSPVTISGKETRDGGRETLVDCSVTVLNDTPSPG